MRFKAYYDFPRFRYISEELQRQFKLKTKNKTLLNKTACFLGEKFNFFIDMNDGVNEDLGIQDYCGKIIRLVEDFKDKPFLHFRTNFSENHCSNIVKIAEHHNGKTIGCYVWCFRPGYYDYILPNLAALRKKNQESLKEVDIGVMGDLKPYHYPKPNATNPWVTWEDYRTYGLGSPVETGYYEFHPRKELYEKMKAHFLVFRGEGYSFEEYIHESFKWKLCFNAPGIGEFTARAFIHSALGQPVFFRKNTYDNPVSWKEYWPEVDFTSDQWRENLTEIVNHEKDWAEKSKYYYEKYLTPQNMVDYIYEEVIKFEAHL